MEKPCLACRIYPLDCPQRELINAAFFTMAMNNGLSAGIINPNAKAMRQAYDTFCVLGGYDAQCMNYIENYAVTDAPNAAAKPAAAKLNLTDSIIKGLKIRRIGQRKKN